MTMPNINYQAKFSCSIAVIMLSTVGLLSACGKAEQAKQVMPAPAVSVVSISAEPVGAYREFVARTVASKEVNLKARVEGELIERNFDEGAMVEQGQVLFKLEAAAYQASLDSAKADLTSRIAGAESAARDLKRGKEVAADGYISQADLDKLITNDSQAKAAVKVAKAALEKAQLNLDYTSITAPFTGRIGKVSYNVGTIVGPNSNPLATLTALDPMFVSFQVEESDFISYLQQHKDIQNPKDVPIDIALRLPNNSEYGESGRLTYRDTKIEAGMGTIEMRAEFDNPNGIILPGLFVTLIIEGQDKQNLSLVPQSAVQENQQGKFVLVVEEDNTVEQRIVKLGRRINAMWVVESGLAEGERVIVEGLQKVRQGIAVKPIEKHVDATTGVFTDLVTQ